MGHKGCEASYQGRYQIARTDDNHVRMASELV